MMSNFATRAAPLLLAGLLTGLAAPAQAGDWSVGIAASTLGFGAEAGYSFNDRFDVRLVGYGATYSQDGQESGIDFTSDLNLSNFGAVLDWHPFAGAFRVSAGWFATDNNLQADGKPGPGGTYDIGGVTFTAAEVGDLRGTGELGSSAPFVGAGWLWGRADGGLAWSLDLGVQFQAAPTIELTSTGGTLSDSPELQAAIDQEEGELENDVDQFEYYPVVTFGVSYRF